jgi:hypothetical protein
MIVVLPIKSGLGSSLDVGIGSSIGLLWILGIGLSPWSVFVVLW